MKMSQKEHASVDSDSDSQSIDDDKHASLLQAMDTMDGKQRPPSLRTEAYDMSEHHIPSAKDEVHLNELVGALHKSTSHGTLKKQLQRVKKKAKVLPVPLSKPEQERVHRSLAYEATTKELSKWDPIVHKNRSAEQLKFPLQQPDLRLFTSPAELIKRSQPKTTLELEVAALLRGSQNVLEADKMLTPAEEKALQAMSVEDAIVRRAELQKYRALLSYKESKARRQKKIKSKRFHRILQKEKKKQEKKSVDELEQKDPEAYLEKLKRLDDDRIEERISLKHRGGSKFAQKQALYKKYDGQTREAFQDMLQKSRELTKKVVVDADSSEEDDPTEDSPHAADMSATNTTDSNPWMTSGIKISKKLSKPLHVVDKTELVQDESSDSGANNGISDDSDDEATKGVDIDTLFDQLEQKEVSTIRQIKTKERHQDAAQDSDSDAEGDEEENPLALDIEEEEQERKEREKRISADSELLVSRDFKQQKIGMSLKRKKTMDDFEGDFDSEEDIEEETAQSSGQAVGVSDLKDSVENKAQESAESSLVVDPNKFMTIGSKSHQPLLADTDSGEDDDDDQNMTIAQAFATDDVIDDFQQEKREISERDKPKDINLTLPGWGDWGGEGIKASKRKKKRFTLKALPAAPRRDRNMDNVIISELKDSTISKHQVRDLPFPFSNPDQFESSIRQPIGKTWNPETAYKKLIKPKTVTRIGTVIAPMDKEAMFKKQKTEKIEFNAGVKKHKKYGKKNTKDRK